MPNITPSAMPKRQPVEMQSSKPRSSDIPQAKRPRHNWTIEENGLGMAVCNCGFKARIPDEMTAHEQDVEQKRKEYLQKQLEGRLTHRPFVNLQSLLK